MVKITDEEIAREINERINNTIQGIEKVFEKNDTCNFEIIYILELLKTRSVNITLDQLDVEFDDEEFIKRCIDKGMNEKTARKFLTIEHEYMKELGLID